MDEARLALIAADICMNVRLDAAPRIMEGFCSYEIFENQEGASKAEKRLIAQDRESWIFSEKDKFRCQLELEILIIVCIEVSSAQHFKKMSFGVFGRADVDGFSSWRGALFQGFESLWEDANSLSLSQGFGLVMDRQEMWNAFGSYEKTCQQVAATPEELFGRICFVFTKRMQSLLPGRSLFLIDAQCRSAFISAMNRAGDLVRDFF